MDEIFKLTTIDSSGDIYLVCEGLDFEFRLVELDENESIGTQVITGFEDFRTLISNIVSLFEVTIIDMGYEQITLPEFNWNMFNELVELDGLYYDHQELDGVVSELLTEEDVKEILRDVVTTAAQQFTETGILIGDQ